MDHSVVAQAGLGVALGGGIVGRNDGGLGSTGAGASLSKSKKKFAH